MKKKAALKALAVLLSFVMTAGNVLAAAEPGNTAAAAAEVSMAETAPTIKVTLATAGTEYDSEKGIVITEGYADSAKIEVTFGTEVKAVSGSAITVADSSSAVTGYSILKGEIKDSLFSNAEVKAEQSKAVLTADLNVSSLEAGEYTGTIEEGYLSLWDGSQYVKSSAVTIKVTVNKSETGDPEEPDSSSDPEEETSDKETEPDIPEESKPSESTPSESIPSESTPSESIPSESTPSESTPSESAPSESTPADTAPSETTPQAPSNADEAAAVLDSALKELNSSAVTGQNEAVADMVNAVADALIANGTDILVEALEDADTAAKYQELDDIAAVAKGVTVDNKVEDEVKDVVDGSKIKAAGVALNAAENATAGIVVSEPEKTEAVSSKYNASTAIQLDISTYGIAGDIKYPVTITMPVPGNLSLTKLEILHYHNGVETVRYSMDKENRTVTFTVTEFSTFVFANEKSSSTGSSHRPSGSSSSSSGSKSSVSVVKTTPVKTGVWVKDATGWWYSYSDKTYPASQWLSINGVWYYFDASGYMAEGWRMVNGKWYYLNPSSGAMAEGWKFVNGKWYYLNPVNGDMATGWKLVNGKWYYLAADGCCLIDTVTPDGYRVDKTGAWVK